MSHLKLKYLKNILEYLKGISKERNIKGRTLIFFSVTISYFYVKLILLSNMLSYDFYSYELDRECEMSICQVTLENLFVILQPIILLYFAVE